MTTLVLNMVLHLFANKIKLTQQGITKVSLQYYITTYILPWHLFFTIFTPQWKVVAYLMMFLLSRGKWTLHHNLTTHSYPVNSLAFCDKLTFCHNSRTELCDVYTPREDVSFVQHDL